MRLAAFCLGLWLASAFDLHAQTRQRDQILGLLSAEIAKDLEVDSLNPTVPKPYAPGWIVVVRKDGATTSLLRRNVLKVMARVSQTRGTP